MQSFPLGRRVISTFVVLGLLADPSLLQGSTGLYLGSGALPRSFQGEALAAAPLLSVLPLFEGAAQAEALRQQAGGRTSPTELASTITHALQIVTAKMTGAQIVVRIDPLAITLVGLVIAGLLFSRRVWRKTCKKGPSELSIFLRVVRDDLLEAPLAAEATPSTQQLPLEFAGEQEPSYALGPYSPGPLPHTRLLAASVSRSSDLRVDRLQTLLSNAEYDTALASYETLQASILPTLPAEEQTQATLSYAEALRAVGRLAEAKEHFETIWKAIPHLILLSDEKDLWSLDALLGLIRCITIADVQKQQSLSALDEIEVYFHQAEAIAGRYSQASASAHKVASRMSQIHYTIGLLLLEAGAARPAAVEFGEAFRLDPTHLDSWLRRNKAEQLWHDAHFQIHVSFTIREISLWHDMAYAPADPDLENVVRDLLRRHNLNPESVDWKSAHYRLAYRGDQVVMAAYDPLSGLEWVLTPSDKRQIVRSGTFEMTFLPEHETFEIRFDHEVEAVRIEQTGKIVDHNGPLSVQDVHIADPAMHAHLEDPQVQSRVRALLLQHGLDPHTSEWMYLTYRLAETPSISVVLAHKGDRQLRWIITPRARLPIALSAAPFSPRNFQVEYLPRQQVLEVRTYGARPSPQNSGLRGSALERYWIHPDGSIERKALMASNAVQAALSALITGFLASAGLLAIACLLPSVGFFPAVIATAVWGALGTAIGVNFLSATARILTALQHATPMSTLRWQWWSAIATPSEHLPGFNYLHERLRESIEFHEERHRRGDGELAAHTRQAFFMLHYYPAALRDLFSGLRSTASEGFARHPSRVRYLLAHAA